jgi:DNA processing protein
MDPAELAADLPALVALLGPGSSPARGRADALEEAGSARALLEQEQPLLGAHLVREAEAEIALWSDDGIELLSVLDPGYPDNLRLVHDRPALLFVAGQIQADDARSVAVIGSRRASAAGLERARTVTDVFIASGYVIVSGLATGIDTAAHSLALGRGARTIAVLGTGLRRSYPAENRPLQQRIAAEGAVVSQFWPDEGPTRRNFPLRNAVMSGLTLATVIADAGQTSGARTQARFALGQGRPVLLAAALLEQVWARELAARPGVHTFGSAAEAVEIVARLSAGGALVA